MQKTISLFLTILLLASSTNVTYAKHFCGDKEVLSVVTFGESYLSCSEKEEISSCNDEIEKDNPCCKTKYENVEIDDVFENASNFTLINIQFVASFISVFVIQQLEFDSKSLQFYADYEPPPLDKDIPVLYQVFVI